MIHIGHKWNLLNAMRNLETCKLNAQFNMLFYHQRKEHRFLAQAIQFTCDALRYRKLVNKLNGSES